MRIELCSETGICSVIKDDGKKADLIRDEVIQIKDASGDQEKIKNVFAQIDNSFADSLSSEEITRIASEVK